ncbi:MAG: heat-shock protein Hsp20 [Candidatus Parcubacteria bacterium]|nr:Hsp20/alpha crystallin family protein [Patescibacteria group bacterium]BCX15772.1 MAG: heat-shock protein Hsp20 [Candidatus Parcubacteria bacterium]
MADNNKEFFEKLAGVISEESQEESQEKDLFEEENSFSPSLEVEESEKEVQLVSDFSEGDLEEEVEGQLTIDVYEDDRHLVIESAVAGVEPEDLDISISPESVTIKGKREKKDKVKKEDYLYQECFWGRFSRSIILPCEIDPDKSHASLKNGILKIVLPKVNRTRTKKVKIRVD